MFTKFLRKLKFYLFPKLWLREFIPDSKYLNQSKISYLILSIIKTQHLDHYEGRLLLELYYTGYLTAELLNVFREHDMISPMDGKILHDGIRNGQQVFMLVTLDRMSGHIRSGV